MRSSLPSLPFKLNGRGRVFGIYGSGKRDDISREQARYNRMSEIFWPTRAQQPAQDVERATNTSHWADGGLLTLWKVIRGTRRDIMVTAMRKDKNPSTAPAKCRRSQRTDLAVQSTNASVIPEAREPIVSGQLEPLPASSNHQINA